MRSPTVTAEGVRALADRYSRPSGAPRAAFLLLVGCMSLFGPLCVDMYLPALPRISQDLHASASEVQLSLTSCLIGLAVGQLIYGLASDRIGRRKPLVTGLVMFVVASLCCAFAPSAPVLALLRLVQGLGGAAGLVTARAMVRDLFEGTQAARVFSMLMLVTGCGPVLAPQLGAALLTFTSWRGVFVGLACAGSALLAIAIFRIPETLSAELRIETGIGTSFRAMRRVGTSLAFLQHAASASLGFGVIFAYVSGGSFVLENVYHASPQEFGALFAVNACGMVAASQLNARIVGRFGSQHLMTFGLVGIGTSGTLLLIVVLTHIGGLGAVLACMFCAMSSNGFVGPNATALSLQSFPDVAGSASALLGLAQFGLGAAVAPIVGLGGSHDAFPMALVMAIFGVSGILMRFALTRRAGQRATVPHRVTVPLPPAPVPGCEVS